MNKKFLSLVLAGFMAISAYAADIVVKIARPAAIVETRAYDDAGGRKRIAARSKYSRQPLWRRLEETSRLP